MNNFLPKFCHQSQQGIPQISGQAGASIALFDAFLINGWNTQTFDSLVITGNVAVGTKSAGAHGFLVDDFILVNCTAPSAINTEWRVTAQTNTTVTFTTTGISDQSATGVITIKFAPVAGWSKPFTGTNKAVYRSDDVTGTRIFIYVDDTSAQQTNVRLYESMTDVDTGTNPTPTIAQAATWAFVKSSAASTVTRPFVLIADNRTVYGQIAINATYPDIFSSWSFGDLVTFKAGDIYAAFIQMSILTFGLTFQGDSQDNATIGNKGVPHANSYVVRNMVGSGASGRFAKYPSLDGSSVSQIGSLTTQDIYPSLSDNGVHLWPVAVSDSNTAVNGAYIRRGSMPGLYNAEETAAGSHLQQITQGGKKYLCLYNAVAGDITPGGRFFFSLDPWR